MLTRALGLATVLLAFGALADDASGAASPAPAADAASGGRLSGFFGRTKGITRLVPASDVWASIHAGTNEFFVVDVRPADEYAKGHVPGALNLPIDVMFRPENLAKLPARDRRLLLVCRSGHTESMALGGLVALGWEPWVMRYGMMGWDAETKVKAGSSEQAADTVHGVGGPIER
jgi:rhodanese-related sulfurtransferase